MVSAWPRTPMSSLHPSQLDQEKGGANVRHLGEDSSCRRRDWNLNLSRTRTQFGSFFFGCYTPSLTFINATKSWDPTCGSLDLVNKYCIIMYSHIYIIIQILFWQSSILDFTGVGGCSFLCEQTCNNVLMVLHVNPQMFGSNLSFRISLPAIISPLTRSRSRECSSRHVDTLQNS